MIGNVTVRDSGLYMCTAEISVGSVRALAFLHITEPPVLKVDGHVSQFVPHGAVIVLDCSVRGTSAPVLCWFKDGHLLQVTERLHLTALQQLSHSVQRHEQGFRRVSVCC
ncbi:hemicentin-1-like [Ictalurus furcatus]|uniref:hemicentin-1-like n=1 Tax=Ictalurus furcatus TaxID=66913 RepID=UPI002350FFDD|nr:hemicentin-1-like [Ictalurus furcatus]